MNYKQINSIDFSHWSGQDIKNYSVVEVKESKLNGENSVNDDRLGIIQNHTLCSMCGLDNFKCIGHFGHIELNVPIPHPMFSKDILDFLTCFCHKESCNKILIDINELFLFDFAKLI